MGQAKYRKKEFYQGAYYHVYNRGVNKNEIFFEDDDYIYYLAKLRQFKIKHKIDIIAYSLLDNHYHLLLKQLSEIPINKFLSAVNTSYGGYFNKKYKRIGPLMQDRYKQSIIKTDDHFYSMSVYVNCNIEIHGLGEAEKYIWSSYQDYLGLRDGTLCNKAKIRKKFKIAKEYKQFCDRLIPEFQEEKILQRLEN